MTRIVGRTIIASPCCKALYAKAKYGSMNFMAYGYWTDGDKEQSLMPTDGGLRMCQCGTAFLLQDTISLDIDASDEIKAPKHVEFAQLPQIIASTKFPHVEVTARRDYWRGLNDEYRVIYRAHRDNEQVLEEAQWFQDYYVSLPAWQRPVRKLLGSEPPKNFPKERRPFSAPPYNPSSEQRDNMKRLLTLILADTEAPFTIDWLEVAELYREQGLFDEAREMLSRCNDDRQGVTWGVISRLVEGRTIGPVRFRM
jgi:hypothetical protein